MGGGRLLPLLALLGAAVAVDWCSRLRPCLNGGTCSLLGSVWVCRCPSRWRGKRCHEGPESAELTEPAPLRTLSSLSAGRGSWPAGPTSVAPMQPLTLAASPAGEMQTASMVAAAAAERTSGGGRIASPSPAGSTERPPRGLHTTPPFTLFSTVQAWPAVFASPAGAAMHESSPLSLSESFSLEGVPGQQQATRFLQGTGTSAQVGTHPLQAPWTPAAASNRVSRMTVVLHPLSPASSPREMEEGAMLAPTVAPGPSLAGVGPPVTAISQADAAETPGQGCLWQSEGSKACGKLGREPGQHSASTGRPEESRFTEGLLRPGLPLPWSQQPPRWSVGPDLTDVVDTIPGDSVGSLAPGGAPAVAMGQRTPVWERQGPTLLSSAGVPRGAVPESEATCPPVSSFCAAALVLNPDPRHPPTGHAPEASPLAPSPSQPVGPAGLPTALPGAMGASGTTLNARQSTAPLLLTSVNPLLGPGPEHVRASAPPHPPVRHQPGEPLGTLAELALSTAALTQPPSSWATAGAASSSRASRSRETSAGPIGRAVSLAGFWRAHTTAPGGGFPHEAAPSQPAVETMGAAEPPAERLPGKGEDTAGGSQTRSASATKEESAHSGPPGLQSQAAPFSNSPSAAAAAATVPTSQVGKMVASSHLSVTRRSWSPPPGSWGWSRASPSNGPTESPAREPPPSLQSPGSSTTSGSTWHTWPPARSDPPVASTWLLAVVPEAVTQLVPTTPREVHSRAQPVFVVENQPPVLKAAFLRLPWELCLAMEFLRSFGSPLSPEYHGLVLNVNETVAPLFAPLPGFQRLEVRSIRPGSGVVVLADAIFLAETPGLWAALNRSGLWKQLPTGLWVANASVEWSLAVARPPNPCAELFSCPAGYDCLVVERGSPTCASVCHRPYCQNQGICTHRANQTPVCQCPVGSDFWFLGMRCDYKVTQHGLLGVACGLLLSLMAVGAAVFGLVVRRVRLLLLEARVDQAKSSYRRFCRLDDVSAHYWSEPWLASANSLDNPAFSNSEELLQLRVLEGGGCPTPCLATQGCRRKPRSGRPRSLCSWERSSGSGNEHMIDSGKASEASVSSSPVEPMQWRPCSGAERHEHPRQATHDGRRPHSYCEGMELVNLERSWTA